MHVLQMYTILAICLDVERLICILFAIKKRTKCMKRFKYRFVFLNREKNKGMLMGGGVEQRTKDKGERMEAKTGGS